jgi:hypothetical protein
MVSNYLKVTAEDLLASLRRMRDEYAGDPDYVALRSELPSDWSI